MNFPSGSVLVREIFRIPSRIPTICKHWRHRFEEDCQSVTGSGHAIQNGVDQRSGKWDTAIWPSVWVLVDWMSCAFGFKTAYKSSYKILVDLKRKVYLGRQEGLFHDHARTALDHTVIYRHIQVRVQDSDVPR